MPLLFMAIASGRTNKTEIFKFKKNSKVRIRKQLKKNPKGTANPATKHETAQKVLAAVTSASDLQQIIASTREDLVGINPLLPLFISLGLAGGNGDFLHRRVHRQFV